MIISKIANNNTAYYYLHAEVVVYKYINNNDGNDSYDCSGVLNLSKSVIDIVCTDIENDKQNSIFVLDFDRIDGVQINVFEESLLKLYNMPQKTIVMANVKKSIIPQTLLYSFRSINNPSDFYSYFKLKKLNTKYLQKCECLFDNSFKEKLKMYIEHKEIPNHSSSVYVSTYINIKKFIVQDKSFVLYSIYRLARKMLINEKWKDSFGLNEKPILVCQSLNGSYIASVLSSLLGLDLFIIDGIGPINKLYRSLGATIKSGKKYIVVSDVVCLGTEVKITKNIIEYLGGIYWGNVSLVRMKSIKTYDNAESVFCIDKKNKDEFKYKIYTSLEK